MVIFHSYVSLPEGMYIGETTNDVPLPATVGNGRRSIAALPSRGTVPSMASTAAVPEPWRMQCLEDHPSRPVSRVASKWLRNVKKGG